MRSLQRVRKCPYTQDTGTFRSAAISITVKSCSLTSRPCSLGMAAPLQSARDFARRHAEVCLHRRELNQVKLECCSEKPLARSLVAVVRRIRRVCLFFLARQQVVEFLRRWHTGKLDARDNRRI